MPTLTTRAPALVFTLLGCALLALAPRPAQAQAYVGASAGQSQFELDCSGALACDQRGAAYKVFGGYKVSHNFALEGTYYRQGKAHFAATDASLGEVTGDYRGEGVGVFAMLIAPYSNKFSLFGKLGVVHARVDLEARSSLAGADQHSEQHASVAWGMGAGYDFTPSVGVRVEFERSRVKFLGDKHDVDMVTASALYRF
ncbi:MAG: outer membrane beta-barrel protein [Rhizobacter sp.]|nr:outer membrane beta-barrel protein [Rhizobacter sp.]